MSKPSHMHKILAYLIMSLLCSLAYAQVTQVDNFDEDTDLTGCSVELNSYIFNLQGLARTNK